MIVDFDYLDKAEEILLYTLLSNGHVFLLDIILNTYV